MATNHTTNYQLNQWEATDQVLRTDFNEDNAKIDAALKANADAIAALEATIGQKGNCTVLHSTYTGDGWYGEDHPTSITFPNGEPELVIVMDTEGRFFPILKGATNIVNQGSWLNVTWSASGVTSYSTQNSSAQMNDGLHHVLSLYF